MEFSIDVPVVNRSRISIAFMATAASLIISACAGGSAENSLLAAAGSAAAACPLLAGMTIASAKIGLPTTGGVIDSAALVVANATGNANGEYCLVKGSIHPSIQPRRTRHQVPGKSSNKLEPSISSHGRRRL